MTTEHGDYIALTKDDGSSIEGMFISHDEYTRLKVIEMNLEAKIKQLKNLIDLYRVHLCDEPDQLKKFELKLIEFEMLYNDY